jgi:hypothetical protein
MDTEVARTFLLILETAVAGLRDIANKLGR